MTSPREGRDGGFVTVAVLGLSLVLLAVTVLLASLGAVAVARHRAAAAADLAALAGARHALEGPTACRAAEAVARAQAAQLDRCEVRGLEVLVEVSVRPPGRLGQLGVARGRAKAGPVAR